MKEIADTALASSTIPVNVTNTVLAPANVAIVQGGFAPSIDVNLVEVNGSSIVGPNVPVSLNG